MAGLKLGAVLGGNVGGTGSSPTSSAMYGSTSGPASPEAITGELLGLVLLEMLFLGVIRLKFSKHFGG